MEELQLTLTPQRVDQRNYGVMLSNWRVGQVLNALVVDTRPNSGVLLSVGGKQFVATTDLPVQPGTNMRLEVKQMGQEIILRQLQNPQMLQTGAAARAADTALALTSAQPSSLLSQLSVQGARFGSPDLQAVARELLGRALKGDSLQPSDLRKALQTSGLFTEADLAAGQTRQAAQSTKATLSQLQAMALALAEDLDAEAAEARVLQQIANKAGGLLNGIAHNQLASLSGDDSVQRWVFTVPVQLAEQFHDVRLQLERDRQTIDGEEEDVWRAHINLDLPQLGPVDVRVQMLKGRVSVNFVCDRDRSSRVLNNAMPNLEQRLLQREFKVERLAAESMPVDSPPSRPGGTSISVEA